ncbi:MAG TPA: PEP-CTERM sorting domain-containing protein [Steroidobacteraceae bacterium]|jgi:hypothetical protein|nr:PEP-CTERM sorting domain-containing protein [Steroidobacteraceae bacterium]
MKRIFAGASCAIVLAALSGVANAAPIYFDFSGTVTEVSGTFAQSGLVGTTISGGYTLETDNLTSSAAPDLANVQFFQENPAGSYAFLNYGGSSVSFPMYPKFNIVDLLYRDTACYTFPCTPSDSEGFDFAASSAERDIADTTSPDFTGTFRGSWLYASGYSFEELIDVTTIGPQAIVTLPLPSLMSGSYNEILFTCVAGDPWCTQDYSSIVFSIDSVARGVGVRTVPEPGTLYLLAVALLGVAISKRFRSTPARPPRTRGC